MRDVSEPYGRSILLHGSQGKVLERIVAGCKAGV